MYSRTIFVYDWSEGGDLSIVAGGPGVALEGTRRIESDRMREL